MAKIPKFLSVVGVALDIREVSWLVWTGLLAVGGGTVTGAMVRELAPLSGPSVVAVGIGSLLMLLSLPPIIRGLMSRPQAGPPLPEVGDIQDLLACRSTKQIFQIDSKDRSHIRQLWTWHEFQRTNPAKFVSFQLQEVDCQNLREATPSIKLTFCAHNNHSESLDITTLESAELNVTGPTISDGKVVKLPTPRLYSPRRLDPGCCTTFDIDIDVRGVKLGSLDFKQIVLAASQGEDSLTWSFSGTWIGEIYDEPGQFFKPGCLIHTAIPMNVMC